MNRLAVRSHMLRCKAQGSVVVYSHYYSLAVLDIRVMWQAVCRYEGVNVSTEVLGTLAELTDNDIRSCLNTLQFLKYAVLWTCGAIIAPS